MFTIFGRTFTMLNIVKKHAAVAVESQLRCVNRLTATTLNGHLNLGCEPAVFCVVLVTVPRSVLNVVWAANFNLAGRVAYPPKNSERRLLIWQLGRQSAEQPPPPPPKRNPRWGGYFLYELVHRSRYNMFLSNVIYLPPPGGFSPKHIFSTDNISTTSG